MALGTGLPPDGSSVARRETGGRPMIDTKLHRGVVPEFRRDPFRSRGAVKPNPDTWLANGPTAHRMIVLCSAFDRHGRHQPGT